MPEDEMTDRAKILAMAMELMETVQEALAVCNLIAGGVVTDPELVRANAAMCGSFLEAMLEGHRQLLDNAEIKPGLPARDMFNFTYED